MTPDEYHTVQRLIDAVNEVQAEFKNIPLHVKGRNDFNAMQCAAQQAQDMLHDAKVERP